MIETSTAPVIDFYQMLQMDPAVLKEKIRKAEGSLERRLASIALAVRPMLIVAFAIILIAPLTLVFGKENNAMLVSLFCILLSVRFVDFSCCIRDSIQNLGLTFLLLFVGPVLSNSVPTPFGGIVDFVVLFAVLVMTCYEPTMGNGGLYGFIYVFLSGNPVHGNLLWKRGILTLLGFVVCGIIFYAKHRKKHQNIKFRQQLTEFCWSNTKTQWQIRLALGVSLLLMFGRIFQLERVMWAGFACVSLLSVVPGSGDTKKRPYYRIVGTLIGAVLFFAIYQAIPPEFHTLFGPLCGIILGFCVDYRYKTAVNCFSALLLASGLYGLSGALMLRIWNNLLGVVFGCAFLVLYQKLTEWKTANTEKAV